MGGNAPGGGGNDRRPRLPHGGGGGGGGPPGDDGPGGDNGGNGVGNPPPRRPPRRIADTDSDRDVTRTRKKEADEVKLQALPKTAADYWAWIDNTIDAITSAARDPDRAFKWAVRVERGDVDFDTFAVIPPKFLGLD